MGKEKKEETEKSYKNEKKISDKMAVSNFSSVV